MIAEHLSPPPPSPTQTNKNNFHYVSEIQRLVDINECRVIIMGWSKWIDTSVC